MKFEVKGEYITLGQFLKVTDWISSGGEAKFAVKELDIHVNGESEERRGRKLRAGDIVTVNDTKYELE